jgi:hypothetical protein
MIKVGFYLSYGTPTVYQILKSPVLKLRFFKQGVPRCKTGFSDLKDSAKDAFNLHAWLGRPRLSLKSTVYKQCRFHLILMAFQGFYLISDFTATSYAALTLSSNCLYRMT